MRIVAGSRKGARIYAPKGRATRPTSDRVREAAFAILGSVEGASVLDLFAGSGALGLEALSRGAASADFVESDPAAVKAIERNLEKLGLEGPGRAAPMPRATSPRTDERYDVVFVDPPYEMVESLRMPLADHLPRVLADGGSVVFETAAGVEPELPLPVRSTRRHGSTQLTVFERMSDGHPSSPSARAATTRSRTATSTSSAARPRSSTASWSASSATRRTRRPMFSVEERVAFLEEALGERSVDERRGRRVRASSSSSSPGSTARGRWSRACA